MIRSREIITYHCSECNSKNVSLEVICKWDEDNQVIDPVTICDKGHLCDECGKPCDLVENTKMEFSSRDEYELVALVLGIEHANAGLVCSPIKAGSVYVSERKTPEVKKEKSV